MQAQANRSFVSWNVETKWFDKLGNNITDDGRLTPLPKPKDNKDTRKGILWGGGVDRRGETAIYELPLPQDSSIATVQCRVMDVSCGDGTLWKPPVDHPITFEAKLKDTDKH